MCIPGSSFLINISVSGKERCGSHPEVCVGIGGATKDDDLVTTSFKIFNASFQCAP